MRNCDHLERRNHAVYSKELREEYGFAKREAGVRDIYISVCVNDSGKERVNSQSFQIAVSSMNRQDSSFTYPVHCDCRRR
jgi:hypothetical protein